MSLIQDACKQVISTIVLSACPNLIIGQRTDKVQNASDDVEKAEIVRLSNNIDTNKEKPECKSKGIDTKNRK